MLFPVRLDDIIWVTDQAWAADIRRTRHIGDFCRWKDHDAYRNVFDRLLRDLKAESAEARDERNPGEQEPGETGRFLLQLCCRTSKSLMNLNFTYIAARYIMTSAFDRNRSQHGK